MTSKQARGGESTRYELSGPNTHVSVATDDAGAIVVTYRYKDQSRAYSGRDVQVFDTEGGRLMTVALDEGAARSGSTLTVLVPHVRIDAAGETTVVTEAVRAIAAGGVEPLPGQSGMYQVVKLRGTARVDD